MQLVRIFTHLITTLTMADVWKKDKYIANIRIQEPPSWSFKLLQQLQKQPQNQRIVQIVVGAGILNTSPKTCCEKNDIKVIFWENCKSWIAQLQLFAKPASDLPGVGSTLQSNSCTSSTCTNQQPIVPTYRTNQQPIVQTNSTNQQTITYNKNQ